MAKAPATPAYPFLIPVKEIKLVSKDWVEVIADFPIQYETPLLLAPGYSLALAIKHDTVGIVMTHPTETNHVFIETFFEFSSETDDLRDFIIPVPGTRYLLNEEGVRDTSTSSTFMSVVRHVLLKHLEPRLIISANPEGQEGVVFATLEITEIGTDAPTSYRECINLQQYLKSVQVV